MKIKLVIIGIFLVGFAFCSQAQTTKKKIVKTQVKQKNRIKHGVRNGELTKGEIVQLKKQQVNIQCAKRKAAADGKITRKEEAVIRNKQTKASRKIAQKKHNNRN